MVGAGVTAFFRSGVFLIGFLAALVLNLGVDDALSVDPADCATLAFGADKVGFLTDGMDELFSLLVADLAADAAFFFSNLFSRARRIAPPQ